MLPCLLTLMSPRLWSAPSCGFSTLGSTVAEVPLTRPSAVASLSRMLSSLFVTRFHRRTTVNDTTGTMVEYLVPWYTGTIGTMVYVYKL